MTTVKIMVGDVIERLRDLPDKSVHCCVTSPPYWGLRDYGTASWEGGDPDCDHKQGRPGAGRADGIVDERAQRNRDGVGSMGGNCKKCGAIRVDKQLGLEPTIGEFIDKMTAVFAEVWRVLRDDGTLWLNMGDCYAGGGNGARDAERWPKQTRNDHRVEHSHRRPAPECKAKDLVGQPWRLAFALQAAGWYLRSDIIWHKPNPMPESCTDRPTKSHEYIFLLTKKPRYFYDADAVREPLAGPLHAPGNKLKDGMTAGPMDRKGHSQWERDMDKTWGNPAGRNMRDVWKMATQSFPEAHFATFPEELPRKCILAGTSKVGCCPECGAPVARIVEKAKTCDGNGVRGWDTAPGAHGREKRRDLGSKGGETPDDVKGSAGARMGRGAGWRDDPASTPQTRTTGWKMTCECLTITAGKMPPSLAPCTVLDPFGGAGTTALVAAKMGRSAILTELNPEYAEMAADRIRRECGLLAAVEVDNVAAETAAT